MCVLCVCVCVTFGTIKDDGNNDERHTRKTKMKNPLKNFPEFFPEITSVSMWKNPCTFSPVTHSFSGGKIIIHKIRMQKKRKKKKRRECMNCMNLGCNCIVKRGENVCICNALFCVYFIFWFWLMA